MCEREKKREREVKWKFEKFLELFCAAFELLWATLNGNQT